METKATEVTSNKKSRGGWWVTIVVAVVVAGLMVTGGAVAAGRLSAPGGEGGERGRPFGQRPNFQIEAAKELPATTPNVRGVLTKRVDNMLTIGVRNGFPGGGDTGAAQIMDVVVTGDTTIYHDITQMDFGGQPPSGAVQQKVEPGSLDTINTNSRITVWGEQNGNQIAAKVLVYSDPMTFRQP
jgi:hypothetical protein